MNLLTLITESQRLAGRVDADFNTRSRRWINEALERFGLKLPWPTLDQREDLVATGQANIFLPQRVRNVKWIADPANKRIIRPNEHLEREFETMFFDPQVTQAYFYRERGVSPVTAQPTVAGPIVFNTTVSESFNAYISGLAIDTRASGTANYRYRVSESVAIGGTTNYTSVNSYIVVHTIGKDDFTAADLVAYIGSDPIARVEANRYRSEYRQLEFLHIPPAGTVLRLSYTALPEALVDNFQIPPPAVDSEYLLHYAASKLHTSQGRPELAAQLMAEADRILNDRIYQERLNKETDLRGIPDQAYTHGDGDDFPWWSEG